MNEVTIYGQDQNLSSRLLINIFVGIGRVKHSPVSLSFEQTTNLLLNKTLHKFQGNPKEV